MQVKRIQYVSHDLCVTHDYCVLCLIQQRDTSLKLCPSRWTCSATGDMLNLRVLRSERCKFIRLLNGSLVSPTYCFLHTMQEMRFITFAVLHFILPLRDVCYVSGESICKLHDNTCLPCLASWCNVPNIKVNTTCEIEISWENYKILT
jgi:hypothetical protein